MATFGATFGNSLLNTVASAISGRIAKVVDAAMGATATGMDPGDEHTKAPAPTRNPPPPPPASAPQVDAALVAQLVAQLRDSSSGNRRNRTLQGRKSDPGSDDTEDEVLALQEQVRQLKRALRSSGSHGQGLGKPPLEGKGAQGDHTDPTVTPEDEKRFRSFLGLKVVATIEAPCSLTDFCASLAKCKSAESWSQRLEDTPGAEELPDEAVKADYVRAVCIAWAGGAAKKAPKRTKTE